jgi:hypothetical protein
VAKATGLNGAGTRMCKEGWIDAFLHHSDNLESAPIFRQWAAIAAIGAVLEQKVYLQTSAPLYPNLYVFLVGLPGVGKTRTIFSAANFLREVPDFHLSPTSMSAASLVDALVSAKRNIIRLPDTPLEYNSIMICADELSAFMHKYDDEMIGNLTTFYDVVIPYGQQRRGGDIKIKIKNPQVSILTGTTPSNLMKFMPESAWDQGFASRVILIYSDQRIISDDLFAYTKKSLPEDMLHDIKIINGLSGPFEVTSDFKNAINNWRKLGQEPVPNHPKLVNYNNRRLAHLLKLSMVSCVDRANVLLLTKDDFNRAMEWLLIAEHEMPMIFEVGGTSPDSKAMDEIFHYCQVLDKGKGVPEPVLIRRARELVPAQTVLRLFEIMERSGMIKGVGSSAGVRHYKATS